MNTKKNTIFKCPICDNRLLRDAKQYLCENNHSFDIAKEGYVNLLLSGKKRSREPGDNQEMILARHGFLSKGYYNRLSEELIKTIQHLANSATTTLIDSACGEGYYLKNIHDKLKIDCYGVDLSKIAMKLASKASKEINYAVANAFTMPVLNNSVDFALSVFSPFNEDEIYRIVKKQSYWIIVTPGRHHLFELKRELYDNVQLNESSLTLHSFKISQKNELKYEIDIDNNNDIQNLVKMTPYYWKTDKSRIEHLLSNVSKLQTRVEFEITIAQSV